MLGELIKQKTPKHQNPCSPEAPLPPLSGAKARKARSRPLKPLNPNRVVLKKTRNPK